MTVPMLGSYDRTTALTLNVWRLKKSENIPVPGTHVDYVALKVAVYNSVYKIAFFSVRRTPLQHTSKPENEISHSLEVSFRLKAITCSLA